MLSRVVIPGDSHLPHLPIVTCPIQLQSSLSQQDPGTTGGLRPHSFLTWGTKSQGPNLGELQNQGSFNPSGSLPQMALEIAGRRRGPAFLK